MDEELKTTEQVIARFCDPELVPHGFLDSSLPAFENSSQLSELHSRASTLLSQLDHHSQELTWQLEGLTGELLRASTKVNYVIEILRSDVAGLVSEVDEVAGPKVQRLKDIENQNDTIKKLQMLVKVKERMLSVRKVFEEAKSFNEQELSATVDKLIENESYDSAIEKINRAQGLVEVWKGTNVYSSRVKFINALHKRVQAAKDEKAGLNKRQSSSTNTTPKSSMDSSRPSTPATTDGYGFFGQLSRRMGY
ncbi:hypothetical protein TRICI_004086 [Trichomonascus ciferrii]|uniref:Conserved oligomeric Golgi complex subunit 7 n=1 Tax=Trichomonascus ciferrii TaxID=44093 RepID=A0A642V3A4_9ASCO|nr:hypothetical protein TRICI_004086 [Trichomonascus ciferrii]